MQTLNIGAAGSGTPNSKSVIDIDDALPSEKNNTASKRSNRRINIIRRLIEMMRENNYRIPKLFLFLILTHESLARLVFDKWYDPKIIAQKRQKLVDLGILNEDLLELDVLGDSGDKPGELIMGLLFSMVSSVLSFDLRHFDSEAVIKSFTDINFVNGERSKLIMDLHLAFWTYGVYLTIIKNTGMNNSVVALHHLLGAFVPLFLRIDDFGAGLFDRMAFYTEVPTIFGSMAGFFRVYHEVRLNHTGRDESVFLHLSNGFFALFIVIFTYMRCWEITRVSITSEKALLECTTRNSIDNTDDTNDDNTSNVDAGKHSVSGEKRVVHPASLGYMLAVIPIGNMISWYWAYRGLRRLYFDAHQHLFK